MCAEGYVERSRSQSSSLDSPPDTLNDLTLSYDLPARHRMQVMIVVVVVARLLRSMVSQSLRSSYFDMSKMSDVAQATVCLMAKRQEDVRDQNRSHARSKHGRQARAMWRLPRKMRTFRNCRKCQDTLDAPLLLPGTSIQQSRSTLPPDLTCAACLDHDTTLQLHSIHPHRFS